MRHCLSITGFSAAELREILDEGKRLKADLQAGIREPFFSGKVLGLLFQKPSLRTRVSFEALVSQHAGSSLYLGNDVGWPDREPPRDFFPILSGYLDALVIRGKRHTDLEEACQYSLCPIINGLTDASHPCQALADLLTVEELSGTLEGVRLAYVGDANNVALSLAELCCRLGVSLSIAAPQGYQFSDPVLNDLRGLGPGTLQQTTEPREAVQQAHFVYTDVWTSMGQEAEMAERLRAFAGFQVDAALMKLAAPGARFLHCLPARRGEEVASAVIDGPCSAVVAQAHNRLHAQKGLLSWLWNGTGNLPARSAAGTSSDGGPAATLGQSSNTVTR